MFPGEVLPFTIEGQIVSAEGNVQSSRTKIVDTFEDGSTLVQESEGRTGRQSATRNAQRGSGRFTAGTGRGIYPSGDGHTEFKASYTLPAK